MIPIREAARNPCEHQENVVKSESTAKTDETHQMLADVSRLWQTSQTFQNLASLAKDAYEYNAKMFPEL